MNARRLVSLLEVFGVYVVGQYVVTLFVSTLRLQIENPLAHLSSQMTNADLLFAARDSFVIILTQYAGWFLLIVPIGWWHRRTGPEAYGLTKAGKSWTALLAAGVAAAALSAWPQFSVQVLDSAYHFVSAPTWLYVMSEMSWRRWEFWLFTAVPGWGVAAFLEELFFRGYCQRRLAEDWGDGPAILGAACLYVFSRGPYMILNLYNLPSLVSLFLLAVGLGVVFAWTRSLVPCAVAHSIINLPMTPFWQVAALTVALLGAALYSRRGVGIIRQIFALASVLWCLALAGACASYAHFSQGASAAVYVGASMLGLAVGLEAMQRDADA